MLQSQRTEPAIGPMSASPPGSFSEAPKSPTKAPAQPKGQTGGAEPASGSLRQTGPPAALGGSPSSAQGWTRWQKGTPLWTQRQPWAPGATARQIRSARERCLLASWSHGELPSPRKQPGQGSDSRASGSTRTSSQGTRHSDTCSHVQAEGRSQHHSVTGRLGSARGSCRAACCLGLKACWTQILGLGCPCLGLCRCMRLSGRRSLLRQVPVLALQQSQSTQRHMLLHESSCCAWPSSLKMMRMVA